MSLLFSFSFSDGDILVVFTDLCRSSSWSPHAVCNSHEDLTQERTRYIYNLLQLNKRMMSYVCHTILSLPFSLPLPPSLSPSLPPPPLSLSLSLPLPPSLSPLSLPLSLSLSLLPLSLSLSSLSLSLSLSLTQVRPGRRRQRTWRTSTALWTPSAATTEREHFHRWSSWSKMFPFYTQKIFRPIFRIYAFELHIQFPSI